MAGELSIETRLAEIKPRMNRIIGEYRAGKDPAIFNLRDEAMRLLEASNLLQKMDISSRFVVVHPQNRYGDGVMPSHVHSLVEKFANNGFSKADFGLPLASQVPPNTNPRYKEIKAFNEKMVKDSMGMLPPIAEDEYHIMSVAKSHSSMASRCIIFSSPHENDKITEGGCLSLHKIERLQPEYARVIEKGFQWYVLIWQAEEEFPGLVDLIMETANLAQQQTMDETRMQLALKISSSAEHLIAMAEAELGLGKPCATIDEIWATAERVALRGSPKFADEVPDLVKYVRLMAGEHATLLKELVSFAKTLKKPRVVTGQMMAAIACADLGPDSHGCIKFRQDLIKAMVGASDKYTNRVGAQNLAEVAALKGILHKSHDMAMLADKMKTIAFDILEKQSVQLTVPINTALDLFGIRMAHHVLQKPDPSRGIYKSMHDIGHAFTKDIANLIGKPFASPWMGAEHTPAAIACKAPALKAWSSNGEVDRAKLFMDLGVTVGAHVTNMGKAQFCVTQVDANDRVVLQELGQNSSVKPLQTIDAQAFLKACTKGDYKVVAKKPVLDRVIVQNWAKTANPTTTYDWKAMQLMGTVARNLDTLATEFQNSRLGSLLEVVISPTPGVYACADLQKDSLTLVPLTTDMRFQMTAPKDAISLPMKLKAPSGKEVALALMKPKLQLAREQSGDVARGVHEEQALHGFVAHYWLVEKTDDAKEANVSGSLMRSCIPLLRNHKDIKTGEKLIMHVRKRVSVAAPEGSPSKKSNASRP